MAMPRVSSGEGGGVVLDPVADHRHHCPLARSRSTVATLSAAILGDHIGASMPTAAATDSAARRLSPVTIIGCNLMAQPGHRGGACRLHGVGHDHDTP